MSSLFKKRKYISWLMIVLIVFQVFLSSFTIEVKAAEDANARLTNYLRLAKGKSLDSIDANNISQEELQILGVYLSNFYIPMVTELSTSRDDNSAKENMVEALVQGASFDKDIAEVLVEGIWDMTMQSATPLYIGRYTDEDFKGEITSDFGFHSDARGTQALFGNHRDSSIDYGTIDSNGTLGVDGFWREEEGQGIRATYFSFLDMFSGVAVRNSKTKVTVQPAFGSRSLVLYWEDSNGNKVPVFDTDFYNKPDGFDDKNYAWGDNDFNYGIRFTPSSLAYGMLMDNLNYKNGIGSAMVDCTLDEFNSLSPEDQQKVSILNARLYVDCFGNILVDYGVAKYVLVPACVNPYAWYVNNDKSTTGKNINLVNLFMLDEAENGHIILDSSKDDFIYNFEMYTGDCSLFNLDLWRRSRNCKSNEYSLDDSWMPNNLGKGQTLYDMLCKYCAEESDQTFYFLAWEGYHHQFESVNDSGYSRLKDNNRFGYECSFGVIDDFIYFDTLNAFKSSKDEEWTLFNLMNNGKGGIFKEDGSPLLGAANSDFSSVTGSNQLNIISSGKAKSYLAGIFASYALAFYNDFGGKYVVNYAYNKDSFPSVKDIEVDWSNIEISSASMDAEIKSLIYYFLHPTKGISLVTTWVKNKVSGIFVGWHEDMVGSSDGTSSTGTTRYLGFSGYVTLPTLSDIDWTAWLLNEYNNIVVYLIIIIFIILITYCIVGSMSFQRAIIGVLMFGIFSFLPPLAINASVNCINNVCDDIYGDKFTYWALVQHQTYLDSMNNAIDSNSFDEYLAFNFEINSDQISSADYTKVKLKWLSPKKMTDISLDNQTPDAFEGKNLINGFIRGSMKDQISGETFVDNENALFLWRDYANIYQYMKAAYDTDSWYTDTLLSKVSLSVSERDLQADSTHPMCYNSIDEDGNRVTIYDVFSRRNDDVEYSQKSSIEKGFTINTGVSDITNRCFTFLLDSETGSTILERNQNLLNSDISKDITLDVDNDFRDQKFGLGSDEFNVSMAMIKAGVENQPPSSDTDYSYKDVWNIKGNSEFKKSDLGNFYFGLYTESPFYFFTWNIYDQQESNEFSGIIGNTAQGLNSKLLDMYTINNQQYFYNYSEDSLNGYGEMRDFCNMRALFYYVIPYLKECNRGIQAWSDLYGTFLYEDVEVKYTNGVAQNFPTTEDTNEYIYKWWHNYNVERLFNTYTPYVDLMYSCDYAKSETISILGEKYQVLDPLDPTSYFKLDNTGNLVEGRFMVFSRSEMAYYGLTMKDLTQVEQKIIKVQDAVYKDLLQLANYSNFDNDVLVTSAGMLTTFAFNKEFSQTNPIGTSYTLYPQSYELKAFSYDAYLRLILAESTGEDLMDSGNSTVETGGKKSYYQRIVENSSITTGIGLIILDLLAVYAIPALKLFFLIAIFFMSVLMIVAAAVKLEMNIAKTAWESLGSPLLKFIGVSLGLAWVVSLFMYDGSRDITGNTSFTISLGDPVMVILVMIVINAAVLILYFKICKKCAKQLIDFAKAIGTSVGGAVAGSISKLTGRMIAGKQISDSVARGTAKARGKSNQPTATTSSGSGGRLSSFAGGALFGRLSKSGGSNTDDNSSAENKYDKKASSLNSKADKSKNKQTKTDSSKESSKSGNVKASSTLSSQNKENHTNFVQSHKGQSSNSDLKRRNRDEKKSDKYVKKTQDKRTSTYERTKTSDRKQTKSDRKFNQTKARADYAKSKAGNKRDMRRASSRKK